MENQHRNILRKMRPRIVRDLDVLNIIDELLSTEVVSPSFWEEFRLFSREKQNQKLLDYLPRRGPEAYSIFKNSLASNFRWIYSEMEALESNEDCVDALDVPIGNHTPYSQLPANPPLSIERAQKTMQLRKGLQDLKPGKYLALHALQGYGKSSLASAMLKDKELVAELFKNEIYWIKFGQQHSSSESILIQLNLLFHLVRNLDLLTEPTSEDSLKYSLKKHFSDHDYALIILDDVNSRDIIQAFDFGCKTLVLTTDTDILKGKENHVITMSDGFSVQESLDLFSKATGIPVSELPQQARQIHDECKGMPLMISMFSAQFEEIKESLAEGQSSHEIWSYYLETLRKKQSSVFHEPLERRATTFDLCMEKLSPEDKHYYKTLAIFPEDVNITTKTLSIFWGVELAEVDSRMSRFCKKALVCREWHECFKSYIYGVHSLVLSHLRDTMSCENLKQLHKTYIENNLKICNGDFSKFPQDNYIHSYIGYHMEKGGMTDLFPKIYLDFGFIETKIFNTGPGDLLIDLKKYKNYITQDSNEFSEPVEDLEKFLVQQASTLAEYRRRSCLDLVQVALKHSFQGFVRTRAEFLAEQRKNSLYLNHHVDHEANNANSYSEELYLQVRSVAFTNEADVILVGNDEGKIISWNCNNRNHVTFYGNNSELPINKIIVPENGKFFVSISDDGKAKLFEFQGNLNEQTSSNHIKTLHPRSKQPDWKNMSESKSNQDDSKATFWIQNQKIMDIAVCKDAKKIAACTDAGSIAMWDTNGNVLITQKIMEQTRLTSIAFTMSSTLIHTVNIHTGALIALGADNGFYKSQFSLQPETDKILSLLSVPHYSNLLIILLETKLYKATWDNDDDIQRRPQTREFSKLEDKNIAYTCAAVTKDGKYVVTADTGGSVNVCDIHDRCNVVKTFKNIVSSLDTHWLEDEGFHIICGGNRDNLVPMVHRWKFNPEEEPEVRRLPLFDAKLEEGSVIAVATTNKTVQIIKNNDVVAETLVSESKITSLNITSNGNSVVYATENGSVSIFDIKLKHSNEIMESLNSVEFMTILNIDDKDVVMCGDGEGNLKIWKNSEDITFVESSGSVINCDLINSVQRVMTVGEKGIKIWDQNSWRLQSKHVPNHVPNISSSSLSPKQNFIALANSSGNLNTAKLIIRQDLRTIKFQDIFDHRFEQAITACSFSANEQFLAVGFKTGEISIMSVKSPTQEIRKLELHRRPVKQLYWSPSDAGEQILVSLTNELAWWNVSPPDKKETKKREISQSLNELARSLETKTRAKSNDNSNSSPKLKTSKSLELGSTQVMESFCLEPVVSSNSQEDLAKSLKKLNGNNEDKVWSNKRPKYSKIPCLLSVVNIDGDLAMKVCISKEFNNFVTINGEGAIYNLNVLETRDHDYANGDT